MATVWTPKTWEDVCKRNAGRRKLHMRKRQARADRIVRLLNAFVALPELRESSYGWLSLAAEQTKTSRATASRDFALCRRMQTEFTLMFGRLFNPKTDRVLWSWDWSHYGFQTSESLNAGHQKAVGQFPFSTRATVGEEAYCGYTPQSWQPQEWSFHYKRSGNLLSVLRGLNRTPE